MACTSGCPTPGAHASWGECARSKNLQIADVDAHVRNQRQASGLKEYVKAREAGLQPKSVFKKDVAAAWAATEATGTPFRADQ